MFRIIILTLLTLLGFNQQTEPKYDLRKPEKKNYTQDFNSWVQMNFYIIAFVVLVICVGCIILVSWKVGFCVVESGSMRNFLARGV